MGGGGCARGESNRVLLLDMREQLLDQHLGVLGSDRVVLKRPLPVRVDGLLLAVGETVISMTSPLHPF